MDMEIPFIQEMGLNQLLRFSEKYRDSGENRCQKNYEKSDCLAFSFKIRILTIS
jgi:hypothetical protein